MDNQIDIMEIVNWVTRIMVIAKVIVAATPTPRDDVIFGKIYKCIEIIALSFWKAKQEPPNK